MAANEIYDVLSSHFNYDMEARSLRGLLSWLFRLGIKPSLHVHWCLFVGWCVTMRFKHILEYIQYTLSHTYEKNQLKICK